jgi:hypothetical protein
MQIEMQFKTELNIRSTQREIETLFILIYVYYWLNIQMEMQFKIEWKL